jgi:hypothetical protein
VATPHGVVAAPAPVARPDYSYIPGTRIAVVTNAPHDVFYYGGVYYRWWNGRWWRSRAWNRGWVRVSTVPDAFLRIPTWHPKYHVVRHHPRHHPVRRAVRPLPPKPQRPSRPPKAVPHRPGKPPKEKPPHEPPPKKGKKPPKL